MISEQAKQGVNHIFTKAVKANLVVEHSDCVEVAQLPLQLARPVRQPGTG